MHRRPKPARTMKTMLRRDSTVFMISIRRGEEVGGAFQSSASHIPVTMETALKMYIVIPDNHFSLKFQAILKVRK